MNELSDLDRCLVSSLRAFLRGTQKRRQITPNPKCPATPNPIRPGPTQRRPTQGVRTRIRPSGCIAAPKSPGGMGKRWWRTRRDPFAEVWEEVEPKFTETPFAPAKSFFLEVQRRHPGKFPDGQLRTFQRRVRAWRVAHVHARSRLIQPLRPCSPFPATVIQGKFLHDATGCVILIVVGRYMTKTRVFSSKQAGYDSSQHRRRQPTPAHLSLTKTQYVLVILRPQKRLPTLSVV